MAGNLVQGAVFTVMVVRAGLLRDPAFEQDLAEQIRRSPRFFLNAPVVLDLRDAAEFANAGRIRRGQEHSSVAIPWPWSACRTRGRIRSRPRAAIGLASFAPNSTQPRRRVHQDNRRRARRRPLRPGAKLWSKTRLVTQPVRSGTQIYARGADLIVTAAVSPGAEIMADGNIHVYGALRGRALAGAGGNIEARIFCSRFEAELVSIAGHYLVSDQMPASERGLPVQISLGDGRLTITRN